MTRPILRMTEVKIPGIALGRIKRQIVTPQQYKVLGMLSDGLLNKQIAYELNVSEATIKAHMTAIFRKLGVKNRTQAVIMLTEMND